MTAKIVLEVTAGPHQGARFEFDRHDTFLVGRAPTANLQLLDDAYFSRHHFLLEFNPPRCYLRDLGSSNGTLVNGQKVTECFLRDGDVISGGKTCVRVTLVGAPLTPGPAGEPTRTVSGAVRESPGDTPAPSGAVVPGYEVVRPLGRGGMGIVYLARHHATGELRAVKLILPEAAADERALQRFLREVRVLSRLDHPRIVRFREMGLADSQFFFAMDYVETIDLEERLAGFPEAGRTRVLCALTCQVLEGLGYAHGQGFIHRDIKPANILVGERDRKWYARLADFGLAKNFESAGLSGMTHDGHLLGTLPFMAPEQILNARAARPAVDLYSVGATLYHLLSGRSHYDFGKRKDRLAVILEDPAVPLTQVCPAVPPALAEVVHRALAKDPADRFPDAEAMRQALLPHSRAATPAPGS
jgi:serine/threonine-protein kinase